MAASPSPHRPRLAVFRRTTLGAGLAVEKARDALVLGLDAMSGRLRKASKPVKAAAQDAADATVAVAQTAQRAAHAPQDVAFEVRRELEAWSAGLGRMAAWGGLLGVLGLFALALLTAAAVEGLDRLFGEPVGALVVGLLYAVGALVALRALRAALREAKAERALHAEHRREVLREVGAPVRELAAERRAEKRMA